MTKRLLIACAIIGALVGVCVAIDASIPYTRHPVADEAASDEAFGRQLGKTESVGRIADLTVDDIAAAYGFERSVSEGFEREVLDVGPYDDVLVADGGSIVGFAASGSVGEVFDRLAAELEGKGWVAVGSGHEGFGSFVKAGGLYTWAALSCAASGNYVGVVVQVREGEAYER